MATTRRSPVLGLPPVLMAFYACESSESRFSDVPPDAHDEVALLDSTPRDDARTADARDVAIVECCPISGPTGCWCSEVSFGGSPDGGVCTRMGMCDNFFVGAETHVDPNGCPYLMWSDFEFCLDTSIIDTAGDDGTGE